MSRCLGWGKGGAEERVTNWSDNVLVVSMHDCSSSVSNHRSYIWKQRELHG